MNAHYSTKLKHERDWLGLLLTFPILFAGCNSPVAVGGACNTTSQCVSGLFCVLGKCATSNGSACTTSADCAGTNTCVAGVCSAASSANAPAVTSVDVTNNVFTLTGTNFGGVTGLQVSGGALKGTSALTISSQASTQLTATAAVALNLAVGTAYNLLLSTASASTTVSVTFTLPSNVVTTPSGCLNTQVLTYNGTAWTSQAPTGGGSTAAPLALSDDTASETALTATTSASTGTAFTATNSSSSASVSLADGAGRALVASGGVVDLSAATAIKVNTSTLLYHGTTGAAISTNGAYMCCNSGDFVVSGGCTCLTSSTLATHTQDNSMCPSSDGWMCFCASGAVFADVICLKQ